MAVAPARVPFRRFLKALAIFTTIVVGLAILALGVAWWRVGRSLPVREGTLVLEGLGGDVTVDRDSAGVPTIRGNTRQDVSRALGFIHAQERFFQMDLARRRAAGELSELFGRGALPTDRSARVHRFRARAAKVLAAETPENQTILAAYAEGVNAGLAALGAAPFEYLLLRKSPRAWVAEDTVLVVASMFFNLQDSTGAGDARAGLLYEVFPHPLATFLNSTTSKWDTPEFGDPLTPLAPPGAEVFDLRTATRAVSQVRGFAGSQTPDDGSRTVSDIETNLRGSNNWAVAGSRTVDGRAIVADDMHLGLGVPNIWFRASLSRPLGDRDLTVTGATLPGVPGMIVGSNGTIAWGFTNTTADWTDRVRLTVEGEGTSARYLTAAGWRSFDITKESILVNGEVADEFEVRETIWGPVDGPDTQGRLHAIAWVPHSSEGMNLRFIGMETTTSLDAAMDVANMSGMPAQNCVFADAQGNIAWTIAGRIPRREGFDGVVPTSWADGTRRWNGWYAPSEYPRIVNPPSGIIVTANNRIVSGAHLEMVGDGGYDPGARARLIREGLMSREKLGYADMMRVHLDDRTTLMSEWRDVMLTALRGAAAPPGREEFRRLIETTWTGRASVDSVAYRLVRQTRLRIAELIWEPFVDRVKHLAPTFPATPGRSVEGPAWTLLSRRPPHLLNPKYTDWNALILDAIDQTVASLTAGGRALSDRTWGEANTLSAGHPISRAVPQLSRWLDLPKQPLPGDSHMPRFQSATNGASERMAVSPGHEAAGYFHMPGGQSGHPRSPNYRDGHDAWVNGIATPFLPGPSVARLVLKAPGVPRG